MNNVNVAHAPRIRDDVRKIRRGISRIWIIPLSRRDPGLAARRDLIPLLSVLSHGNRRRRVRLREIEF